MATWVFSARTIIEEHDAQKASDRLRKKFERFDDAYNAFQWLLARSCSDITCKTATVNGVVYHLHRRAGDDVAGTPDITILFIFDDDTVTIIGVDAEIVKNGE